MTRRTLPIQLSKVHIAIFDWTAVGVQTAPISCDRYKVTIKPLDRYMKNPLKLFIFFEIIVIFLIPHVSVSDVAFLTGGRQIIADKIWIENDKVVCSLDGNKISFNSKDVLKIEQKKIGNVEKNGFHFDAWQSGMDIGEILTVARRKDIPLHKDGLISINKKFNPATSSKYAKTATHYYYKTKILGRHATVNLLLTPESKRLHTLSIHWHGMANKNNRTGFEEELTETLSAKYGTPKKRYGQLLGKAKTWSPSPWIAIELQMTHDNFIVSYKDIEMLELQQTENERRNDVIKQNYQKTDSGKF